ncbi:biotin--[acetyl-CoA-carboxylase] ligase [Microcella sp.]|uniref:biotin--[acetyl-CoA-carboxylase] ligase n=1 Tax=Microcella sp. TaxID=1913979 RepID=UPI00255EB8D2|nr:biotin--[acetyl-CoA-carboxylase] ligase [Microcella sp.]MBX9472694.1 biotin--[acetyl-CoA-carboxylase] ligase [Microcella sp.]
MLLPLSRAIAPDLDWRERCASTNTELVARAGSSRDLAVIATDTQTAGRGRLDRVWSAPSGTALAVSVLVRHDAGLASAGDGVFATHHSDAMGERTAPDPRRLGWLPLIAGVAMTRAVQTLGVGRAGLKWPNDVLVHDRKLSGILTELTSIGVVIGAGLNLSMTQPDLPVPTATSLVIEGVEADDALTDRALAAYLGELLPLVAQWRAADLELLPSIVVPHLQTLGRAVRVERPGLPVTLGTAMRLDDDGRLIVQPSAQGSALIAVAAGDVTHLRYE